MDDIILEATSEVRVAVDKTSELGNLLFDITEDDITASFIYSLFGDFNGKPKCNPYDIITIPKGKYGKGDKKNKNSFKTTIGIWIFNKYFIEPDFFEYFGYINETITKKKFKDLNQTLSYKLMEDKITIDQMSRFIMKTQFFMQFITIIAPNYTEKMLTCSKVIGKKKDELCKKYAKEIENGDIVTINKIEKELLDYASEYLGDDPALDSFKSGSAVYENNFKNMFVIKGPVLNPDPNAKKKYDIVTSNYIDGIKKEDYAVMANALTAGPYSRGRKTQIGGWWEKLFGRAFQDVYVDEAGSDCGSTQYITVTLDKDNMKGLMYSYIVTSSGNLVELNSDNMDKYMNKTVKMRSTLFCKSKKPGCYCNKCAGNQFIYLNRHNAGSLTASVASSIKLISMKSFHDANVKLSEMDPMKAFGLK